MQIHRELCDLARHSSASGGLFHSGVVFCVGIAGAGRHLPSSSGRDSIPIETPPLLLLD